MKQATVHSVRPTLRWSLPERAGKYTLLGMSRAADATAWVIPELGWCVDAGEMVKNFLPHNIFITHTHEDHIQNLYRMRSRLTNPHIFVPKHAADRLDQHMKLCQEIARNGPIEPGSWDARYTMCGVEPDQTLELASGRRTYVVKTLRTDHTVPSVGYALYERRNKLKPEFVELSHEKIRELREAGEEITAPVDLGIIAFLGDCTEGVLEAYPELLELPAIVMDCTFLAPDHLENAARTKHGHWLNIEPYVRDNPETTFILSHISWRYDNETIRRVFEDAACDNVIVWADLDSTWDNTMRA